MRKLPQQVLAKGVKIVVLTFDTEFNRVGVNRILEIVR